MGYGGGSGGPGGGSGSGSGSDGSGGSGYRRVGDDRTANLKVNNITNRTGTDGTEVDGIVEVNTTAHFIPPSGTTAERGSRGRAVFTGGYRDSPTAKKIDYITIPTLGNATEFGSLTNSIWGTGVSSSTRGIFAGSIHASLGTHIEYFTISATGNSFDFGDLSGNRRGTGGCSNQTRAVIMGGFNPSQVDIMEYVTISTKGDVTDFGNLEIESGDGGSFASPTRGIFFSARVPSSTSFVNIIEYITIASTGDAKDFGDQLSSKNNEGTGCSSSVRGIKAQGNNSDLGSGTAARNNVIEYITIASTGDAIDFGDLTVKRYDGGAASTEIRGVFYGGNSNSGSNVDTIDYVTIATLGNAADFGDAVAAGGRNDGLSDSHGGLG